ncbi:hypothetical protein B0H16DRAFT_1449932 [Mycena metata]|uniref:Uncharacterized protein n=1 Tax=Mycena metata TaxID=1033252 RepID=A0AAD7K1S8_9AGAR|nr:hypothetical protein B0H16DRAFT_1449932 [Mycena metata]
MALRGETSQGEDHVRWGASNGRVLPKRRGRLSEGTSGGEGGQHDYVRSKDREMGRVWKSVHGPSSNLALQRGAKTTRLEAGETNLVPKDGAEALPRSRLGRGVLGPKYRFTNSGRALVGEFRISDVEVAGELELSPKGSGACQGVHEAD